jgi:hypothetical protein
MRNFTIQPAVLVLALCVGSLPAFAQGRGGGRGPGGPPQGNPAATRGPSGMPGSSEHPGSEPNTTTGKRSVSDLLTQNTKLSSKIHDLTGMNSQDACSGFKNLGQCVAAAHVSKNLGIDFSTLKGKVTGTGAKNLGQAIHVLDPNVNSKAEAKKAQKQAQDDLRESTS